MRKKRWTLVAAGAAMLLLSVCWLLDIPSWRALDMAKLTDLSQTTVIYDADDCPAADMYGRENRVTVSIDEVPMHVQNAFIAIEDARFYEHCGVDVRRIGGALLANLRAGGYREGASTITQQLIKLTHLSSEKRLSRKAQEAWLALQLERRAEKTEILEMYLNVVYFGRGAYGIEAAAQTYFGKGCETLTLAEGALLAGVIKAPGTYAPHLSMERAMARRKTVLEAMAREEMISWDEAQQAMEEEVRLAADAEEFSAGWYVDWALREAAEALNCETEDLLSGGYRIYTALEPAMQATAERLFEDDAYFPGNAEDGTRPESALIAIDPAQGEILCMVGGRSYEARRTLNRATQIRRQPGSAFKPISVYAAAVDFLGFTPVSMVQDRARDFGGGYTPSNASGKEYGAVTLREALARSMNLAAVDLITKTGVEAAKLYVQRAGIVLGEQDANLSLALGSLTDGVSPAQMSAAYAPLVNGGRRVEAHTVRRIEDMYGKVLYEFAGSDERVMSVQSARLLTSMLETAVSEGTARALGKVGFPVAAKTGTVGFSGGGNRDAWTLAVTPAVSLAVWQGFDRPDEAHVLPEGATGGAYPARLAAAFLAETRDRSNGGEFETPQGLREVLLDGYALEKQEAVMLAGEGTPTQFLRSELLPEEQMPVLTSRLWDAPVKVERVYVKADEAGNPAISFIVPDAMSEYRVMREEIGREATEVGCITGSAGEYATFVDHSPEHRTDAQYYVIARHVGFLEIGRIVESEPSERAMYRAPSLLERMLNRAEPLQQAPDETPLF